MKFVYTLLILLTFAIPAAADETSAVFNWSDPTSLSPAFKAPTSENRYGEYISKVTFSASGASFTINDDNVKELSQKARFLYGYETKVVEMRAYPTSILTICAPDGANIKTIAFEGAKVTADYISTVDDETGTFTGSTWKVADGVGLSQVELYIDKTINCTKTTVTYAGNASVGTVSTAKDVKPLRWYDLTGRTYTTKPAARGVYIVKNSDGSTQRVIVK